MCRCCSDPAAASVRIYIVRLRRTRARSSRKSRAAQASGESVDINTVEGETVTLAYWAPMYVTVDVERREVTSVRVLTSGMLRGPRIRGEPLYHNGREAAAIVDAALAERSLPPIEIT
jgi:hypothetical protein